MTMSGIDVEDLPDIYREEYLRAVELIREEHDPATEWDEFVDGLWSALVPALGLDAVRVGEGVHPNPGTTGA